MTDEINLNIENEVSNTENKDLKKIKNHKPKIDETRDIVTTNLYSVDYSKRDLTKCKICRRNIPKNEVRLDTCNSMVKS